MKKILVIATLVLVTLYGVIITISYIDMGTREPQDNYQLYDKIPVTKDPNQSIAFIKQVPEKPAGPGLEFRYEIRVQNDYDNERLEVTNSVEKAIAYLKQYKRFHNDLYVYNLVTGELVTHSRRIALNDDNEQ